MAITRIGQYPFEQNYPQTPAEQKDRGLYQRYGDIYTFGESASNPYTGSRSLAFTSKANAGFGWPIPGGSDDLRGGFFWAADFWGASLSQVLMLYESDNTTPLLEVDVRTDEAYIDLLINGVSVQKANLANFAHFMDIREIYCHHGWHVIGGSRFVYTIDGVAALDYTDAGVPTGYEYVWHCESATWGFTNYIDDMYLEDVAGESYAVPPSYRYMMSIADGDGTIQGWAKYPNDAMPDYLAVDDTGVDDEDTYVWIGSANDAEMFDTADVTLPLHHSVVSAIPWALARKRDVTKASQLRMVADDGVGTTNGSDQNLPGWYAELWERMLLDPQSNPWSESTFNSCEFGFESRGTI